MNRKQAFGFVIVGSILYPMLTYEANQFGISSEWIIIFGIGMSFLIAEIIGRLLSNNPRVASVLIVIGWGD
jgi:glucose-6-phosphate isomerase